ncbi:MAG: NADH-quinone oxidoreductase subunit N [Deltaproteobacteria bacterium]|nr:NADH-quinone oxidoreductase subunit N [Deltaproteobacteria bacterium]
MSGALFAPEVFFVLAALWFFTASLLGWTGPAGLRRTAFALALVGTGLCLAAVGGRAEAVYGTYRFDPFSQLFKVVLSGGLLLTTCVCRDLGGVEERHQPEFYGLLFFCTAALLMLVSANHFLTLYLALELSSYSLYVLVALRRQRDVGLEAGMKYFLVGIVASAAMLFGLALFYASTGTSDLPGLRALAPRAVGEPLAAIGLSLALSGLFFKLAVFPFHFWAPDAYQGAPNQVAAYLSSVSKVAGIAVLVRVAAAIGDRSPHLPGILFALAVASMTFGNLAAIAQADLKRLFAYSTIAHAGYVLVGILTFGRSGYASAAFYALALLAMKFSAFLVVIEVASDGRNLRVRDLAGLHRRSPLLALTLLVSLLSLAGIPPTVGFTGKFLVFLAAMRSGYFALVLVAMINVVVSLYYYLLVIKAAYLLEPEGEAAALRLSRSTQFLSGLLIVAMVLAGLFPYPLMRLADAAAGALP